MVNIKVVHKENVRRFTLPSNATWIELEAKLRSFFSIPPLVPFTLSYKDEDNDVITLSTDIELQEILSSSPTIKFNLKFSAPDDSSDSEESNSEVWVFEGRSIPPHDDKSSSTDSGLQDNVSQSNITSTTNKEPQFIEIDSRDSNKNIPISFSDDEDDFESVNLLVKKTSQVSLSDGDYEAGKSLDKKTTILDEDEVGKSLDKKTSLLDDDYEIEKSLGKKNSLLDEDHDVGKSKNYLLDKDYDVGKSLDDKKICLSDEDYEIGKSLNKKTYLDEDYDVGKSLNKKTYLDEDYDVGKSLEKTSISDDVYEVGKSLKKTSLFDDDYDVEKSLDKKTPPLFYDDYDVGKSLDKKPSLFDESHESLDSFHFNPNMAKSKSKFKSRNQSQRGKQIQKETIGTSPPNNASNFTSFSDQSRNTFAAPIPIPGAFPSSTRPKPAAPVIWAGQTPPDFNTNNQRYGGGRGARGARGGRGGRGSRGKNRNQNYHHHQQHHHNEFLEKEGTSGGEEELEELVLSEEVPESQDTKLEVLYSVYPAQVERLKSMGFNEDQFVELLFDHEGDLGQTIEALLKD